MVNEQVTLENNESMEICVDNNLVPEPTTKAISSNCHIKTPNATIHSTSQMPTPPLTVSAPTPIPLDPATKTAQIIAQIKERAYAKTHSSPEVAPLEFIDDLDDSDDDDFFPALPTRYDIISSCLLIRQGSEICFSSPAPKATPWQLLRWKIHLSNALLVIHYEAVLRPQAGWRRIPIPPWDFLEDHSQGSLLRHRKLPRIA